MGEQYSSVLTRDLNNIYGLFMPLDDDMDDDISCDSLSCSDTDFENLVERLADEIKRAKPTTIVIKDIDDHFEEAMEMFPPDPEDDYTDYSAETDCEVMGFPPTSLKSDAPLPEVSDEMGFEVLYDSDFSLTSASLETIPEEDTISFTLDPEFDSEEVREQVRSQLETAESIRETIESISQEEAELSYAHEAQAGPSDTSDLDNWLDKIGDLSDRFSDYSEILSSKEVDHVIKHIEEIVLLFISLKETRSLQGASAIILGYLSKKIDSSMFNIVRKYISMSAAMEAQAGEEGSDTPQWLDIFRSVTKNWKSVTTLPAWRYLSKVLSLAVSAGLCHASHIDFRLGDLKVFSFKVQDKQASALDLIDAVLATADYFVEAGYEAFKTGSLRPFFFDNQTARILDDAYIGISASMKAIVTGDLANTTYKTEGQLAHVLENTLTGYILLRQQSKNPAEKRTLDARCMQLEEWKLQFIQQTVAGGLREAPYSVYLVGEPGIGKSMMTQVLVDVVMKANNKPYTKKQVATVNPGDKFASTVKNDTLVIILDDFGNFVLEFETENPLKYIIEICNNVVSYVPKAEANEKGKVSWRPDVVITTSNLDDLLFGKLSNKPGSAKRRGFRMKPRLKPEYAEHGRFSEEKYREIHGEVPVIPDAYEIDIQEWGTRKWEYMQYRGCETRDMSYQDALNFHIENSQKHFQRQKKLVATHGEITKKIAICQHNCLQSTCSQCKNAECEQEFNDEASFSLEKFNDACDRALGTDCEPHFGIETIVDWGFRWLIGRLMSMAFPLFRSFGTYVKDSSTEHLALLNARLHFLSLFGVYDWLPECVTNSTAFEQYLIFTKTGAVAMKYYELLTLFLSSFLLFILGPAIGGVLNGLFVWPYLVACATRTHCEILEEFRSRRNALPVQFTATRDSFYKYLTYGVFFLTGLTIAFKMYRSVKAMEPHGNISPKSMADIHQRDSEESDWARVEPEPLPATSKSKCITHDDLVEKVKKNLVYINYEDDDGKTYFTNGFFVKANELVLPYHILREKPRTYTIYRKGEHVVGARFREIICLDDAAVHPEKDMALVQCCNTSPFADLTEYLALEKLNMLPFSVTHQSKDGSFRQGHGILQAMKIYNSIRESEGYAYNLHDMETFTGMCMATMVTQTRAPMICGFHIGGRSGTREGCAVSITLKEYEALRHAYYAKHISALEVISEGTVYTEHYGVEWYEGPQIHAKSPLNWLPVESNIRYFGSCKGRTTWHSEVVQTPISEKITEVCGAEKEYAGPHFHRWKSWYESLIHSCNPAIGSSTSILDWAVTDYENQLWTIFDVEGIMEEVKKLDDIDTVSGQDGIKFVNAMVPNSAAGYPLTGAKRGMMIELPPDGKHECPRTFSSGIWEEVRRFKGALRSGQRYYPMFKTCLKDEVTPVDKEKVRAFQAAPLTVQLVVREYFLPLARVFSLFPLVSECAVGINAQGPEWDELQEFIKKYGIERIVAGDYSKYDLRMSAKLTSAAFKILIDFAEKCGYSQDDLAIMRGVATEIIYPMMAYNGDVVMLQGSNPSGQNLTVYINSIVNSLLNRIGFRMIYPDYTGRFCDAVALATYGDDFKSSASKQFPEFHHLSLAEKLSFIEMTITMPNKKDLPTPFMSDYYCDFLKRHNRFHEVGWYVGALDEESILKSLKAVLRSKHVSLNEQAAMNIDGALREWFLHGRDVYETRREQMKIVAAEGGISHMCSLLEDTFDDRVRVWKEKYAPFDLEQTDDAIAEAVVEGQVYEPHSGEEIVTHDLCEWDNCTLPAAHECAHNNCTPPFEAIVFADIWWRVASLPVYFFIAYLVACGRIRMAVPNLSFSQRFCILFGAFFLGLKVWWEFTFIQYMIFIMYYCACQALQ